MVAARFAMDRNTYILVAAGPYGAWGIGGKTKALGYSWSSSSTPDWNTGNVVEINTFGKDGLDLRRFDYGVAIGLSVEYRHYVIGVEGRLGLCKLQKELQGKNITGFVTAGYKFLRRFFYMDCKHGSYRLSMVCFISVNPCCNLH